MQNQDLSQPGCYSPPEIARLAEEAAIGKAHKKPAVTFVLAILAGIAISLAGMFYAIVTTGAQSLPYGLVKLMGGLSFSMGLMMVILCGAELFTSNTLLLMGGATQRLGLVQITRNWAIVYMGNLVGSLLMVAMLMGVSQHMDADGQVGRSYLYIANAKMGHTFTEALILGILCNLVVCLTYWMSLGARFASGKLLACTLPVACFVVAGFEHSVANMFLLPMGWLIQNTASPDFWSSLGYSAGDFGNITLGNLLLFNLLPVTVGNVIGGGVMVGLGNWFVHLRK